MRVTCVCTRACNLCTCIGVYVRYLTWCAYKAAAPSAEALHFSAIHFTCMYKNEEGCGDDTVPKTSDTRRPCEVGSNNLQQPPKTKM